MKKKIKIFTWHIHGSYLYYLSLGDFEIYIPVNEKKSEGYIGLGQTFPFNKNVHEIPVEQVKDLDFDCILFQTPQNLHRDQFEIFSKDQLALPKIYLEHDPPQQVPTNTQHSVNDENILLVHVTHFNRLMWDNGVTPSVVIDHGIPPSSVEYSGEIPKGLVVINNLNERGRRLGLDIYYEVRNHVPIDLIGMDTKKIGGLGEILHPDLPDFTRRYRFFFNPIRYTSLGLAVLEAMMIGIPVVGLATTEMVTVIRDRESGILHTNVSYLIKSMQRLIEQPAWARELGRAGKKVVEQRFNIKRFSDEWYALLSDFIENKTVRKVQVKTHEILEDQL